MSFAFRCFWKTLFYEKETRNWKKLLISAPHYDIIHFSAGNATAAYRGIAQLVESRSPKPLVVGSSPTAPAIKGLQKRCSPRNPRFYRGFRRFYGRKTASDFVDVKKILFPFWNELNSHTTEYPQSSAWINQVHALFLFPLKGGKRCESKRTWPRSN